MEEAPLASKPEAEPGAETEVDSLDSVDPYLELEKMQLYHKLKLDHLLLHQK